MKMWIEPGLCVTISECDKAPPPFPLKSGFSEDCKYRILGGFTMSESAEMYFMLANDNSELWFISNRHLRLAGRSGASMADVCGQASLSDIRTKQKIRYEGLSPSGLKIYSWEYTTQPGQRYRGVIAQSIQDDRPEAVIKIGDMLFVDYSMLDVKMEVVT